MIETEVKQEKPDEHSQDVVSKSVSPLIRVPPHQWEVSKLTFFLRDQ